MKHAGILLLLASISIPAVASAETDDLASFRSEARAASMRFMKQLAGEMKAALGSGGPVKALSVCKDKAPAITGEQSRLRGWKMTRVSLKYRNPMLGMPDDWEAAQLQAFEQRRAKGEKPDRMEVAEIVTDPTGRKYYRYMKAIGTRPMCLMCHGDPATISPEIRRTLETLYPHDLATGFKAGDIRGAISIKAPAEQD